MKRSSPKRFPGLTWAWSGVIAASLLAGCGGAGEAEAPAQPETQTQAATNEPTGPVPRIESMDAIALDSAISSQTRSIVRARLAQGQETLFQEIPMEDDSGARIVLRDDGLNGDERAGDFVFSGVGTVDLESHRKTQDRIAQFQAQQPDVPLTWATFDNRELVREERLTPLSPTAFRPGIPIPIFPAGLGAAVKPDHSLIITHTGVITDPTRTFNPCTGAGNPNGVWTFKHLVTQMANTPMTGVDPAVFVENWLQQTNVPQTLNTFTVPARTAMNTKILNPWPRLANGRLDLNRAPFKLVAIVNRLDLGKGAGSGGYGGGTSGAGELRFVFAAVDRSVAGGCRAYGYLDIFEYGVSKRTCPDVRAWAQGWLGLSSMAVGTAAYNTALQNLTQQVVMANMGPGKPNGSAINQIRRNEIMLAPPGGAWELREWELRPGPFLQSVTTDMTPHDSWNNTALMGQFIGTAPGVLTNSHTVPLTYGGQPFLGANPQIPNPATMFWNGPPPPWPGSLNFAQKRHKVSLLTCNSCHARETNTNFTHINENGVLSPFLATGMPNMNNPFIVADPVTGVNRAFYEIRDRAQHLDSVANQSCSIRRFDLPLLSVH